MIVLHLHLSCVLLQPWRQAHYELQFIDHLEEVGYGVSIDLLQTVLVHIHHLEAVVLLRHGSCCHLATLEALKASS